MKHTLLNYMERFPSISIAVVGDVMLDGYIWGSANRISPEAPVPVLEVSRMNYCLGGAANVMRNIATLGGHVYAFGLIGDDGDGKIISEQLESYGISAKHLTIDPSRRTTHKQRVIAGNQQLLRIDYEDAAPASLEVRKAIVKKICSIIESGKVNAVVFEDYNKGLLSENMLTEIIAVAKKHKVITVLDPKPGNLSPVKGLTMMKPNRPEAMALANIKEKRGENRLVEAAETIRKEWEMDYLLISMAADGMAIAQNNKPIKVIPTRAREVFDVSGAGDTVIAACSLALAAGALPEEAAELANYAAGIVVGKVGTVSVEKEELTNVINQEC